MAKVKITLPNINAEELEDKDTIRRILSYLYQLNDELRYQLTHIDEENLTDVDVTDENVSQGIFRKITNGDLESFILANAGRIQFAATKKQLDDGLAEKLGIEELAAGVSNASVTIDPTGIELETTENGQIIARIGEDIELQIDKNGVTAIKGVFDSVEAPNIMQAYDGGSYPWQGTIQATLDAIPKYLKGETIITIPEGTYHENVKIEGFKGARLNITNEANKAVTIIGVMDIMSSDRVTITGQGDKCFVIYPTAPRPAGGNPNAVIFVQDVGWLDMSTIYISGVRTSTLANQSACGIWVVGSYAQIYNCCIEYTFSAAINISCAHGYIHTCKGGGSTNANSGYSVRAMAGGMAAVVGSTAIYAASGTDDTTGWLKTSGTLTPTTGGITYVAPTTITQSFTPSKHVTYLLNWSRTRDDTSAMVVQGSYRGKNGNDRFNAGLIWFASATSALAGKTVVTATLKIRRASGGYSNAVPVWLSSSTLTEANYNTTYDPPLTTPTTPGSLTRESEGTYDVTSLMSAILSGGALAVYENKNTTVTDTWSPAYTQFYGHGSNYEPVLTVTYS